MQTPIILTAERAQAGTAAFFRSVYGWMAAGLTLTAVASLFTLASPALLQLVFGNKLVFWGLVIAEFGMVMAISAALPRLSATTATLLFCLYAALNGVTFAAIFLVYTGDSIASTFFITAGTFGAMSCYGLVTKKDLSSWGSFLFMGLIGVFIASLVNIFLHSPAVTWVASCCGVLVFTGLTAYDTFKLKQLASYGFANDSDARKAAVFGALQLYLDFINLFLMLLNLFGDRRR